MQQSMQEKKLRTRQETMHERSKDLANKARRKDSKDLGKN